MNEKERVWNVSSAKDKGASFSNDMLNNFKQNIFISHKLLYICIIKLLFLLSAFNFFTSVTKDDESDTFSTELFPHKLSDFNMALTNFPIYLCKTKCKIALTI